tara:strand:+ start:215 stop:589 length:375 start_codon:yes stop_codon:yes gene_type:complete
VEFVKVDQECKMSCKGTIPIKDLSIYRGDNETINFRYVVDGVPVDITGYQIFLECASATLSREAVIKDQTTNIGQYSISFVPEDTKELDAVKTAYEVVFWPTGVGGEKNTKHKGHILIASEVVP